MRKLDWYFLRISYVVCVVILAYSAVVFVMSFPSKKSTKQESEATKTTNLSPELIGILRSVSKIPNGSIASSVQEGTYIAI